MAAQFAIADKVEWLGVFGQPARVEAGNFLQPSSLQHRVSTVVYALVQRFAFRLQANSQNTPSGEGCSSRAVNFGQRFFGQQADFDCANELLFVGESNSCSRLSIKPREHCVQVTRAVLCGRCAQALAQFLRAQRQIGEAFEQRPQIKPSANRENRQTRACPQIIQNFECAFAIAACGRLLSRIENVEQMMWNTRAFGQRRLRGANIKTAIQLSGIASNNFAAKFFGKENTERGFAGGVWPNNRKQRWITGKSCHQNRICQPRMMRMTSTTSASSRLPRTCWRTIFTAFSRMILRRKKRYRSVAASIGRLYRTIK